MRQATAVEHSVYAKDMRDPVTAKRFDEIELGQTWQKPDGSQWQVRHKEPVRAYFYHTGDWHPIGEFFCVTIACMADRPLNMELVLDS